MARDEIRIREQLVQIDGGSAVVDLPVLGLPSNRVGVVDEHWQWECRSERGSFVKAKVTQGSQSAGVPGAGISFVRIYFTASMPLSATGG
jgi:hypothetical protein